MSEEPTVTLKPIGIKGSLIHKGVGGGGQR